MSGINSRVTVLSLVCSAHVIQIIFFILLLLFFQGQSLELALFFLHIFEVLLAVLVRNVVFVENSTTVLFGLEKLFENDEGVILDWCAPIFGAVIFGLETLLLLKLLHLVLVKRVPALDNVQSRMSDVARHVFLDLSQLILSEYLIFDIEGNRWRALVRSFL